MADAPHSHRRLPRGAGPAQRGPLRALDQIIARRPRARAARRLAVARRPVRRALDARRPQRARRAACSAWPAARRSSSATAITTGPATSTASRACARVSDLRRRPAARAAAALATGEWRHRFVLPYPQKAGSSAPASRRATSSTTAADLSSRSSCSRRGARGRARRRRSDADDRARQRRRRDHVDGQPNIGREIELNPKHLDRLGDDPEAPESHPQAAGDRRRALRRVGLPDGLRRDRGEALQSSSRSTTRTRRRSSACRSTSRRCSTSTAS
jgi:hypothetical protein